MSSVGAFAPILIPIREGPFIPLHPHVLVIDELGYQSYAADAANVLFRVVSIRHLKRRPILVTTNKPLAALGQVLHDADLADAILDRLLERGTHYVLLVPDPSPEGGTTATLGRRRVITPGGDKV